MKVLIDNGADVNHKNKVSSDSLLFYWWICLVKVCIGWFGSIDVGMQQRQVGPCEGVNW